jgi:hypothetical protein
MPSGRTKFVKIPVFTLLIREISHLESSSHQTAPSAGESAERSALIIAANRDPPQGWTPAKLRPGNVHSAEGWEELLLPEIERQQRLGTKVVFRADAAFAKPCAFSCTRK